ncbi:MAG: hypothetical protein PHW52_03935 [Candidatus Pacebacteria bacterium]|nr:hypothetical protein [Candidatus Paceibacterota bacterium]
MEYKEAINILLEIREKYQFNEKEKEAILLAIGTLDCGSLADNRLKGIMKSVRDKHDRNIDKDE